MVVESRLVQPIHIAPVTGNGDQPDGRKRRAQSARELIAVHAGQTKVEQGDLRLQFVDGRQRRIPIGEPPRLVAPRLKEQPQRVRHVGFVVYDEHPARVWCCGYRTGTCWGLGMNGMAQAR